MKTAGYILGAGLLGVVGLGMLGDTPASATPSAQVAAPAQAVTVENLPPVSDFAASAQVETKQKAVEPAPKPKAEPELSNDNYYTNVDGNQVHSPAYAPSQPSGASARCRDGTYSFSQNRRGTCSHHGGVAAWL